MMPKHPNPWAARFEPLFDNEEIFRRAKVSPNPLGGLSALPVEQACHTLRENLKGVFFPTTQCVHMLKGWAELAYTHSSQHYPDTRAFISGVYGKRAPLPEFSLPICVTGLAGIGKTELIKAFRRIQTEDSEVSVGAEHSPFPLRAMWAVTVKTSSSSKDLLSTMVGLDGKPRDLIEACRKRAYRDGVSIILTDEFQFATQSSSANARVTQMLLSLGYLGIPLFYVANFSLLNRLMRRPQEDKQRLLTDPIILLPDTPESDDWLETLAAYKAAAPEIMNFDVEKDSPVIHRCSAGIKRAVVALLVLAYRIAREFDGKVSIREIEMAYQSPAYVAYRRDVEDITRQMIENRKSPKRDDLWCPIDLPKTVQAAITEKFRGERGKRVAGEALRSGMSPEERAGYDALVKSQGNKMKAGTVMPLKRKAPVTFDKLKDDADWFRGQF